jgi:hypothetical protein
VPRDARVLLLSALALSGCYLSHGRPEDASRDGALDAPPADTRPSDARAVCDATVVVGPSDVAVDLLFVVDNSGSMSEEQRSLIEEFPRLVSTLATGDLDGDGEGDFPPVTSLHTGVVTTDLGGGPVMGAGCPEVGDDGILRTGRTPPPDGCDSEYPPFLMWTPETDTVDSFAHRFGCVAEVGTGGCGIEQPFEAALKALTPSDSDIRFMSDRPGNADRENAGFRRDDAILGIIFVTDEDDCSIREPELFDPDSATYFREPRCYQYEDEALHPIGRYVDGFRRIQPDPDRLVLAAIAGVPGDLLRRSGGDYAEILAASAMRRTPDPMDPLHLLPSCQAEDGGVATPPVRIVRLLQELGESSTIQSICEPNFTTALRGIIDRLSRAIRTVGCGD